MKLPPRTPALILDEIRALDRIHWSTPSDRLADIIHQWEREYQRVTGLPCPAWPKRETPAASEVTPCPACGRVNP